MLSIGLRAESDLVSQAESEVRWRGLGASGPVRGEAAQSASSVDMAVYYNECRDSKIAEKIMFKRENRTREKVQNS